MLVRLEGQVLQRARRFLTSPRRTHSMRTGEFGHDESASAQAANEAAKNGIGHTGHRRQHRGGGNRHPSDLQLRWEVRHESLLFLNFSGSLRETGNTLRTSQLLREILAMK